MAVYRPTYIDPKTGKKKTQAVWWYSFVFAGRRIQESSKSTRKTIAVEAEKQRRRELEKVYNGIEDRRQERIRPVSELADEYFEAYKLRNQSLTFAEYALGHVKRLLGGSLKADIGDRTVKDYQTTRLEENAAPKTINEEVGFLLRLLGEQGDFIRAKMRREKTLKLRVGPSLAKAFTEEEKTAMLAEARRRATLPNGSKAVYPALCIALRAGIRDKETRRLRWMDVDLVRRIITVAQQSKSDASTGRTVPMNDEVFEAVKNFACWYRSRFDEIRPAWYLFAFGKPQPHDPTRHQTSFKTVWAATKDSCGISGRWHDCRHTFITDLAETGEASDETIRDLAGHVSQRMLKHYSHIRMEAKRRAINALGKEAAVPPADEKSTAPTKESTKVATEPDEAMMATA